MTRLSRRDLGFTSNAPVYLNEHLCHKMKKVLRQVIAKKKKSNWRLVRIKNGTTFACKLEDAPVVSAAATRDRQVR